MQNSHFISYEQSSHIPLRHFSAITINVTTTLAVRLAKQTLSHLGKGPSDLQRLNCECGPLCWYYTNLSKITSVLVSLFRHVTHLPLSRC